MNIFNYIRNELNKHKCTSMDLNGVKLALEELHDKYYHMKKIVESKCYYDAISEEFIEASAIMGFEKAKLHLLDSKEKYNQAMNEYKKEYHISDDWRDYVKGTD